MNDLRKATITTLDVAEMMESPHKDILKKLEGAKDRKGYIQILAEGQMSPSDYFLFRQLTRMLAEKKINVTRSLA